VNCVVFLTECAWVGDKWWM